MSQVGKLSSVKRVSSKKVSAASVKKKVSEKAVEVTGGRNIMKSQIVKRHQDEEVSGKNKKVLTCF